jgi:membrane-associated protease RseP (regulator of RpoE activity)
MAVTDVFAVYDLTTGYKGGRAIRLRGRLLVEASEAYERVAARFKELRHTPLFRRDGESDVILAIPGMLSHPFRAQSAWLPAAMFIATLASVLFVGAVMEEVPRRDLLTLPGLLRGWPFALSLLSILAAHELGHYFTARRLGTPVSLPHFIPMPFGPLGTMGAVINMQGPPRNRRQLLAIAAAGPLAGLLLAVPVLILGLSLSEVERIPWGPVVIEGNSLLYVLLKYLLFGRFLPSGGMDVFLHPVAFAGWAGLMITGVNLIPVGQLDGGHIIYALLGRRARWLNWVVIASLALLALVLRSQGQPWDGWFLWAALLFFFSRRTTLLLDEITHLDTPRKILALLIVILFVLTFVPIPMRYSG